MEEDCEDIGICLNFDLFKRKTGDFIENGILCKITSASSRIVFFSLFSACIGNQQLNSLPIEIF